MTEIELSVEIKHLLLLMNFLGDLTEAMGSSLAVVHSIFHIEDDNNVLEASDYKPASGNASSVGGLTLPAEINWTNHDMKAEDEMLIYIEKFIGGPISIKFSLISQTGVEVESKGSVNNFMEQLSSYGVSFLNLTEAPIMLNWIVIDNIFGFHGEITSELTNQYV